MSRSSAPVLTLPALLLSLPLFLIDASSAETVANDGETNISCSVKSCAALDMALLQEYVTGLPLLNDTDQRINELSSDESLLPFGALASDWTRLILLQNRQPEGTPLRDNLLRLSRLMLAAYFDSQDVQLGQNITATISDSLDSTAVPESEDQQANNVTLGSTAQKESAWINASFSGAYNNEEEPVETRAENFAGNDGEDSTPTSYYADSTLANFNQAFSTLVSVDNEASGSKSNETSPDDNEDESTTESWIESFSSSASPALLHSDPGFASNSYESSRANEAIHPRSKEDFLISRYASKESRHDDDDDDIVAKFFAEEHDASADSKNSMEDLLALMDLEEVELEERANASATSESPSPHYEDAFEFNTTKSLEALLESMERLNTAEELEATTINFELAAMQNSAELDLTTPPSFVNGSVLEEIIEESSTLNFQDSVATEENRSGDSVESHELIELLDGISAEYAPTTQLVQMISGKFSSEVKYSNEVSAESGRTDRSGLYSDTTLPNLPTTTDKASSENHTRHPDDVLFKETRAMTADGVPDDWRSTSSYEEDPHHQSRKILMIFRHGEVANGGNKLKGAKENLSPWTTKVASREESEFNLASLRNRLDLESGIAGMNKLKRAGGTELLDVERQYRTFRAKPGQTQFAEKRPDEEEEGGGATEGSLPQ